MIKAILFDFGQTLVNSADGFKQAEGTAKEWIFADLFPSGGSENRPPFLDAYRRIRKDFHDRSVFSRPAIWERVYRHFDHPFDHGVFEEKEHIYWETVKQFTRPFQETVPVMEQLAASYPLALITNTQGQKKTGAHRIALFPELERFFEMIVVAGESGIPPKPSAEPFLFCLQRMGCEPGQAAYVGDDWRIDINGARDAGLHPVWLKHHSVHRNWPEVQTDLPIITGLDQLSAVVKTLNQS